jgi:nucleoside phosphorylase
MSPASATKKADFVIMTALPEEREAVRRKLLGVRRLPPSADDVRVYYEAELPVTFPDASACRYRIVLLSLLNMGRVEAATATSDAIRRWQPRYLVLVGIAGGIAKNGARLGDVIVGDQIVDFELQKLTPEGPFPRDSIHRADPRLLNAALNLADDAWLELITVSRPKKGLPGQRVGPVATGDKVIASPEFLERVLSRFPKIVGVEMEAGGAASASFQAPDGPGFLVVRGISDLADANKDTKTVQAWRSYACDVAASYAIGLLKSGPVPRREEPDTEIAFQLDQYFLELDRLVRGANLENLYIPLNGTTADQERVSLDAYVARWLKRETGRHLAILGDYGTGKSWFCLRLAKQLADAYREAPGRRPLPLLVSFRRYRANVDLQSLIKAELLEGYGIDLCSEAALSRLLRSRDVLLILDGLDEMAKSQDSKSAVSAYNRLGVPANGPRVLLTCRTHYFHSGSEEREVTNAGGKLLSIDALPTFEAVQISLFDHHRVSEGVARRFNARERARVHEFITSTYNLMELCSRPVLLSLVCDSYELFADLNRPVTSADLYEEYVRAWLRRESATGRLHIDPAVATSLIEDIAHYMVGTVSLVLRGDELKQVLSAILSRSAMTFADWPDVHRQLVTSTFIRRTSADSWEFAHRSFQEYFYACKFFRWERETAGKGEFSVLHVPIWQFIAQLVLSRWDEGKALHWIDSRIDRRHDTTLTLTTLRAAAAYWLIRKGLLPMREYPLAGVMLDSVDLEGVDFSGCDLSESDLHRSSLRRANLSLANLRGANLEETEFADAVLTGINLSEANISQADFRGVDWGKPDSKAWRQSIAQLTRCNGTASALFDESVLAFLKTYS